MRRYLIEKKQFKDGTVHIEGDLFHHICEVCRQGLGSKFEVLTEEGRAYVVEIKAVQKKMATAIILDQRELPKLKKPYLHLQISIPRFAVFEDVLEKSVELGVQSIQPFFSDFSFVKSQTLVSPSKWSRWEKIIKSSIQQSGRGESLVLNPPCHFEELLKKINPKPGELYLFAYEGESPLTLKKALTALDINTAEMKDIYIYVGSEGGFSFSEVQKMQNLGLKPVTLGDQVLRVETACISLISILKYHYECS